MAASMRHILRRSVILQTQPSMAATMQRCSRCLSSVVISNSPLPSSFRRHNGQLDVRLYQVRHASQQEKPKGFISGFVQNLQEEAQKSKAMKDSLAKFREEAKKLEQSEKLKQARSKFEKIQAESQGGSAVKQRLHKLKEVADESGITKQGEAIKERLSQTAETVSKGTEQLAQTEMYKKMSKGAEAVGQKLFQDDDPEDQPRKLRKREDMVQMRSAKAIKADEETLGIALHKDSRFTSQWKDFKDNNKYMHKVFKMKSQYDESDNIAIRATRAVTDGVKGIVANMFSSEMGRVLTEIDKIDPSFSQVKFIEQLKHDIIPNIMLAIAEHNYEVLEDWTYEAVFNIITTPMKEAEAANFKIINQFISTRDYELVAAKVMDQGPVLVVSFVTEQIVYVEDSKGNIIEGSQDKVMRVDNVWAFCRDMQEINPEAAWRVLDMSSTSSEQWI